MDKYDQYKYYICCPMCDLEKCVKGSAECEAEMWAENMRQEESTDPQSTKTQQVTGKLDSDCISRQAAVTEIAKFMLEYGGENEKRERDALHRAAKGIKALPSAQPEQLWIPCSERMPECEQEVLICTMKKVYVSRKSGMELYEEPIITPALYEDGTMLEVDSKWRWEDIDYAGWDEEEDCGIIPEGWWENRHFNQNDVYNNVVDKKVIAWMPLPEPYKAERREGGTAKMRQEFACDCGNQRISDATQYD